METNDDNGAQGDASDGRKGLPTVIGTLIDDTLQTVNHRTRHYDYCQTVSFHPDIGARPGAGDDGFPGFSIADRWLPREESGMSADPRRAHPRFKDDRRVCCARLEEETGGTLELDVIDMSAGGAALCGLRSTRNIANLPHGQLKRGHVSFSVPSTAKGKALKMVDVGSYEVVREWPPNLGNDAGIAIRFRKPRKEWTKLIADERFLASL